jgi:Na+/H+-translocating membrane pyrophosphatase
MDNLKKAGYQDRSKINMHEPHEVQHWTKHLDKVGNGAAAVRKQLSA